MLMGPGAASKTVAKPGLLYRRVFALAALIKVRSDTQKSLLQGWVLMLPWSQCPVAQPLRHPAAPVLHSLLQSWLHSVAAGCCWLAEPTASMLRQALLDAPVQMQTKSQVPP